MIEGAGIIETDPVILFLEEEQMSLSELCGLGSPKELAIDIEIKKGDAVRLHRLSSNVHKKEMKAASRKRIRAKDVPPSKFRTVHAVWFIKGNKNKNTPERCWLKKKLLALLEAKKVAPDATYYALLTDIES